MGVTMHDTTRRWGSAEVQTLGGPAELLWPRSSHLTKSARDRIEIQFSAELWRDILYEHLYTTCICPQKKKDWKYICGVYFWVWDLMAILLNVKKKTFYFPHILFSSVQFSSVAQSCPTLCDPMDCSTPGFPVHHRIPELTQTHVHRVDDAIQPSHPLSSPSPPVFIFPIIRVFSNESAPCIKWPKYWSFSFSISPSNEHPGLISFRWTGWISLQSKGLLGVFSNTTVQKQQFFSTQLSL